MTRNQYERSIAATFANDSVIDWHLGARIGPVAATTTEIEPFSNLHIKGGASLSRLFVSFPFRRWRFDVAIIGVDILCSPTYTPNYKGVHWRKHARSGRALDSSLALFQSITQLSWLWAAAAAEVYVEKQRRRSRQSHAPPRAANVSLSLSLINSSAPFLVLCPSICCPCAVDHGTRLWFHHQVN